jgi:predicted RND superfamily exporter protein
MLAFVTTLTVLPLLLTVVPTARRAHSSLWISRVLDASLTRLWSLGNRRPAMVVLVAVAFLAVGAAAGRELRIDNEYVGSLPKGEVLDTTRALEEQLSGVVRVVAYLDGPPGSMKQPAVLRAMQAVEEAARREPTVNTTVSVGDLVAEANQAFEGGNPSERRVPDSPQLIAQYLTMVDPVDRADFVNDAYSRAHVLVLAKDYGSPSIQSVRSAVQRELARQNFEQFGIHAVITGHAVIASTTLDSMVAEMLWGFVLAFAIVVALIGVVFRSVRIALVSIVPNLIPVGACFATIRALGFGLRIDSALFLSVCIGGLFNTTVHIAANVLQQQAAGRTDPDEIVKSAMRTVGPASAYTASILSMGFAVLLASGFSGLRQLGLLSMVMLSVAFLSDAAITSTLLRRFHVWKPARAPDSAGAPKALVAG